MKFSPTHPLVDNVAIKDSLIYISVATLVLLTIRYFFIKWLARPYAFRLIPLKNPAALTPKENSCITKFCKYCWHTTVYVTFFMWNLQIIFSDTTFFDITTWVTVPNFPEGEMYLIKIFIWTETAWYIHGLIETMMHESKRIDFILMLLHHVIATILLYFCWYGGYGRVGVMVTCNQDIADIVVYIAKIWDKTTSNPETGEPLPGTWLGHTIGVTLCWISWVIFRWGILGYITYGVISYVPHDNVMLFFLTTIFVVLFLLQIIWGIGITKMLYEQLTFGRFFDLWHDQTSPVAKLKEEKARLEKARLQAEKKGKGQ